MWFLHSQIYDFVKPSFRFSACMFHILPTDLAFFLIMLCFFMCKIYVLFSASLMYNEVIVERRCFVNQGSGRYEFYLWPKLGEKHVVGRYYKWVEGELLLQKAVCIYSVGKDGNS